MAGLGVVAGIPDIIAVRAGQLYGLELKTDAGRVSPAQAACHARLEAAGAVVAVARGLGWTRRWRGWNSGAYCAGA